MLDWLSHQMKFFHISVQSIRQRPTIQRSYFWRAGAALSESSSLSSLVTGGVFDAIPAALYAASREPPPIFKNPRLVATGCSVDC